MDATSVLRRLQELGVTVKAEEDSIFTSPASTIPEEVKADIREHKSAILARLHRVWDGQAPPLVRPPRTEQELRRLKDYWEEPGEFARWLEWDIITPAFT